MSKSGLFGWLMYDLANTTFSALFVTVYFPLFVLLLGGTPFHVGLAFGGSMLIAGLLVPLIGAVADLTGSKKSFLIVFTIVCCLFTFLTGLTSSLALVLGFGLIANLFYHAALDVYDAQLVDQSTKKNIGTVSGLGIGFGYLGTIVSVLVAYFIGFKYGFENLEGTRIIFFAIAIMFLGLASFNFFLVKEKKKKNISRKVIGKGFWNVISTIRDLGKNRIIWLFLLASFLYTDGANTVIIFLFLFAKDRLGLTLVQFFPLYIAMAVAALIGSFLFGAISDKIGPKNTLMIDLFLWAAAIILLAQYTTHTVFIIVGLVGGMLLGGLWTVTRVMLVKIAPKEKIAELFGYQGLTEKYSAVIGPVLFGYIATVLGFAQALWVTVLLFLLGASFLVFVE